MIPYSDLFRHVKLLPAPVQWAMQLAATPFFKARRAGGGLSRGIVPPRALPLCVHESVRNAGLAKRGLAPTYRHPRPCARAQSIAQGAATQTYLATSPDVASLSGEYFADVNLNPSSAPSHDAALSARLWEMSERMCGFA